MHFYDSIRFPFLSDLLFNQLLNFDWEASRKEIEEEKKRECKKDSKKDCCKEHCGYLRMLDDDGWNKNLSIYSPKFELGEDDVYRFHTTVPKDVKPEEVHIDAIDGTFYFGYDHKTDNGSFSAASIDSLPNDIDINSMRAVLKNGEITITASRLPEKECMEEIDDDETEYELEIGK